MKKNSKVIIHFKEGTTLPLSLSCILIEDSISFIIVKNNVELMIPWCNIDYISEDISESEEVAQKGLNDEKKLQD